MDNEKQPKKRRIVNTDEVKSFIERNIMRSRSEFGGDLTQRAFYNLAVDEAGYRGTVGAFSKLVSLQGSRIKKGMVSLSLTLEDNTFFDENAFNELYHGYLDILGGFSTRLRYRGANLELEFYYCKTLKEYTKSLSELNFKMDMSWGTYILKLPLLVDYGKQSAIVSFCVAWDCLVTYRDIYKDFKKTSWGKLYLSAENVLGIFEERISGDNVYFQLNNTANEVEIELDDKIVDYVDVSESIYDMVSVLNEYMADSCFNDIKSDLVKERYLKYIKGED